MTIIETQILRPMLCCFLPRLETRTIHVFVVNRNGGLSDGLSPHFFVFYLCLFLGPKKEGRSPPYFLLRKLCSSWSQGMLVDEREFARLEP